LRVFLNNVEDRPCEHQALCYDFLYTLHLAPPSHTKSEGELPLLLLGRRRGRRSQVCRPCTNCGCSSNSNRLLHCRNNTALASAITVDPPNPGTAKLGSSNTASTSCCAISYLQPGVMHLRRLKCSAISSLVVRRVLFPSSERIFSGRKDSAPLGVLPWSEAARPSCEIMSASRFE
jgi:hypothetical protein